MTISPGIKRLAMPETPNPYPNVEFWGASQCDRSKSRVFEPQLPFGFRHLGARHPHFPSRKRAAPAGDPLRNPKNSHRKYILHIGTEFPRFGAGWNSSGVRHNGQSSSDDNGRASAITDTVMADCPPFPQSNWRPAGCCKWIVDRPGQHPLYF